MTPCARAIVCTLAASALAGCGGSAGAHRPVPREVSSDTAAAEWGDEHPGLVNDDAEWSDSDPASMLSIEGAFGDARSVSARASRGGVSIRGRAGDASASGAVAWSGEGWVRNVVAGSVRPTVGEGALLADRRDEAQLRVRPVPGVGGLRLAPSSLVWGTGVGAGITLAARSLMLALGGWRARDSPSLSSAWTSLEWRGRAAAAGVSAGTALAGTSRGPGRALSVFGGRGDETSWASAEVGVADGSVRALARAFAGDRHQWRTAVAAGATPGGVATENERWGAALEREDRWNGATSRTSLRVSAWRAGDEDRRRRRVEWSGTWKGTPTATLEAAARFTRDERAGAAASPFVMPSTFDKTDELRARVALRTRDTIAPAFTVENQYRIEVIEDRGPGVGVVGTWVGRVRRGLLDARLRASAFALRSGQVAYVSNSGVAGASAFSASSHSGASLAASLRLSLGRHAGAGFEASRGAAGATRWTVTASASW